MFTKHAFFFTGPTAFSVYTHGRLLHCKKFSYQLTVSVSVLSYTPFFSDTAVPYCQSVCTWFGVEESDHLQIPCLHISDVRISKALTLLSCDTSWLFFSIRTRWGALCRPCSSLLAMWVTHLPSGDSMVEFRTAEKSTLPNSGRLSRDHISRSASVPIPISVHNLGATPPVPKPTLDQAYKPC